VIEPTSVKSISRAAVPELLLVPAGEFLMGDDAGRHDERPAHPARVQEFLLARFPTTNDQYASYLAATGAIEPRFWNDPQFNQPLQPVVGVSWFDAVAYCDWLTAVTGRSHRLPTEAEREWAALGGPGWRRYPWGDDEPPLVGPWARGHDGQDRPLLVSDAAPNGYRLCHMQDNVHEWCSDWYDRAYYSVAEIDDPRGPDTGDRRVSRGGAWRHDLKFSRIASRSSLPPHLRYNDYGFRVAASIDGGISG
jgi:iron(II)-dependent oxidoreductase